MSKKTSLILLGIASLGVSRLLFLFVNDPEGPNVVVVGGLAVILYVFALGAYWLYRQLR